MAKVTVDQSYLAGFDGFDFSDLSMPTKVSVTSKKITATFEGGTSLTLAGSGFKKANGIPVSGTIKSIDVEWMGEDAVEVTSIKVDVKKLAAILKTGDFSEIDDIVKKALGGDDHIKGGKGDDKLNGYGGDDKLYGRAGNDTMTGGHGDDTFAFATALNEEANVDRITDFNRYGDNDSFEMKQSIFKGLAKGKLEKAAFMTITDPEAITGLTGKHRILYDKADGDLYYDRDGSGTQYDLVKFAEVQNNAKVGHTDFFTV